MASRRPLPASSTGPIPKRVLALTVDGQSIEFDAAPEFPFRAEARGFVDIRRPRVYPA